MKWRFTAALCRCYLNLPTFERISNPSICVQSVHMFLPIGGAQINTGFLWSILNLHELPPLVNCSLFLIPFLVFGCSRIFWNAHSIPDHSVQCLSLLSWSLLFSVLIILNILNLKELLCIMYNKVGTSFLSVP